MWKPQLEATNSWYQRYMDAYKNCIEGIKKQNNIIYINSKHSYTQKQYI